MRSNVCLTTLVAHALLGVALGERPKVHCNATSYGLPQGAPPDTKVLLARLLAL